MQLEIITKDDLKGLELKMDEILSLFTPDKHFSKNGWLRSREVRHLLKISDGTLKNYRDNGTVPYRKIGGTYYYSSESVNALFNNTNN
ncbi:MAG: helix-turn-helix domain-containing protein [Sediminibacterium sp.]|nr:helix-turn-helix domain-containing protein [Sediminibacterium sp.]MDP3127930.1 helix-turn-helix domain-containing protein [Sediminibacterium sp.]